MPILQITIAQYLASVGISTAVGSFGLRATRDNTAGINTLTWTWPSGLLVALDGNITMWNLTLQRSNTASNRPNAAVVYSVGLNTVPAVDANWTNVKQWTAAQFIADGKPSTWSDAWPISSGPVIYRLILNFAPGNDPVIPPWAELTWNTRLIVPPYTLTVSRPDGATATTLSWTAPQDVSWWP